MNKSTLCGMLIMISASPVLAGQLKAAAYGCKAVFATHDLMALQNADEKDDFRDRFGKLIRSGDCRVWSAGENVGINDQNGNLACLAAQGAGTICYWTDKALIELGGTAQK